MLQAKMVAALVVVLGACVDESPDLGAINELDVAIRPLDFQLSSSPRGQKVPEGRQLGSLSFSTYLGFGGNDYAYGVAVDSSGSSYITGLTEVCGAGTYAYVAKHSATGTQTYFKCLLPATSGGGIAVDAARNAYIVADDKLFKIDPTGGALVYGVSIAGWTLKGVAVDSTGNAYITGSVNLTGRLLEAVVAKVNPSGTAFVYGFTLGGTNNDVGNSIAIDASGSASIAGTTESADFPVFRAFQPTLRGPQDAFVAKFSSTGTQITYSTFLGGDTYDYGNGIALDTVGNAYVVGSTASLNGVQSFPVSTGTAQFVPGGGGDAYVAKLSATGLRSYATYLGGSGGEIGNAIAVDKSSGIAYVTGYTQSANFPIRGSAFQGAPQGTPDAFVTQVNSTGSLFNYSSYLGGATTDLGNGIAVDAGRSAYIVGSTLSSNFPTTVYAYGGLSDAFVTRILGP
jgi:hypothetical protein